jgi:hypothetical protein
MHSKTRDLLTRNWQSEANLSLFLFFLIVVGFVLPSVGFAKNSSLYYAITFSVLSVVGSAIAWGDRRLFVPTSLLCFVAIVTRWASFWRPTNTLILWDASTAMAAIFVITAVLLSQVFRSGPITAWRLQGAIAAYLCIGFGWSDAYHIVALLDPGAFKLAEGEIWVQTNWINYSFGMLTTVGYAGIVTESPVAHSLGSAEAITGQLYLAVLLARLVSMRVSTARKGADESSTPRS